MNNTIQARSVKAGDVVEYNGRRFTVEDVDGPHTGVIPYVCIHDGIAWMAYELDVVFKWVDRPANDPSRGTH